MNCLPPHFICIGAQRSGTSWMFSCFSEHPEIFMPQKEMHFFDRFPLSELDSYRAKFSQPEKVCGEITPDYLSSGEAVDKIAMSCPDAKIIVILRDPVERTSSSYMLYKEQGVTKDKSLSDVFKNRSDPFTKSLYGEQLEYLFSKINAENIKVVFFERIKTEPEKLLKELFAFIGVNDSFIPKSARLNFNASSVGFGSTKVANVITKIQNYLVKRKWGYRLLKIKKTNWFKRFKTSLIEKNQQKSESNENYYGYFAEDIVKLESQIGQTVPESWKPRS
jgi:hypothetical protein